MMKKICMLGASAVGKTSLVRRFVEGGFSDRYLTTVGVKIDRKTVTVGGQEVQLVLWDLNGEDRFQKLEMRYLRGAAGYLLVVDGTRRETLERALLLHERVQVALRPVPWVLALNKHDLERDWELEEADLAETVPAGGTIQRTSAKTGTGVEEAFRTLAEAFVHL